MPPPGPVIGVDIGGTKILGLLVDAASGEILDRRREPTPYDSAELTASVLAVVASLDASAAPASAIGVGVPGLVDRTGVLRFGPNVPGVVDLDLTGPLRRRFGLAVVAVNDASCAALAEHRLGAARGTDHAVVVTQGTGIGGGIIIDGRLLLGANGFAGEPGHVLVDPSGPPCACGVDGHWEAVASGTGLANLARQLLAEGRGRRMLALADGDPVALRGEHVSAAFADGDPDAAEVLHRFACWVARGLGGLIAIFDPEVVVLGGGLAAISDHFLDEVRTALPADVLAWEHRPPVRVVAAELGPDAGAIGAALLALDSLGPQT